MAEDVKPNVESTSEEKTFELKVDGEVKKVDEKTLLDLAQKGLAVLPKVQSEKDRLATEFEELKEKSAYATELADDLKAAIGDDDEAAKAALEKIGEAMGWSAKEVEYVLSGNKSADEDDSEEDADPPKKNTVERPRQTEKRTVGLEDLDPKIRRRFEQLEKQELEAIRDQAYNLLGSTLADDSELGKFKKAEPAVYAGIERFAKGELQRRVVAEGASLGPKLVDAIVRDTREFVKSLGISAEKPITTKSLAAMGLGPIAHQLGDTLQRNEAPKAAKVTDRDYNKNFAQRLAMSIAKAGGLHGAGSPTLEDEFE